jgi:uncharacterized OsmC-like protein
MQVNVSYQEGLQFFASARSHLIVSDQPFDNGGCDRGMTPPEWFLAALGSCAGFYVLKYLEARKLDPSGLNISVSADKAAQPVRLDGINIRVTLPYELEPRHQKGLHKAIEACIIHNTLMHPPSISAEILTCEPADTADAAASKALTTQGPTAIVAT